MIRHPQRQAAKPVTRVQRSLRVPLCFPAILQRVVGTARLSPRCDPGALAACCGAPGNMFYRWAAILRELSEVRLQLPRKRSRSG